MLVSELRKSLTGLDRAVKTYSFMLTEDQVPLIQVQPTRTTITEKRSFLQKSPDFSSFDSERDCGLDSNNPYPSGGLDNFATGIMDTFESNLLKLKDFQTQSLPNVFEATKHFNDDACYDISPLSSASVSTVSILDATDLLDATHESPNEGSRAVFSNTSPLAVTDSTYPKGAGGLREEGNHTSSGVGERAREEISGEDRVGSTESGRTWESSSPVGSECSERDLNASSPQPLALERAKFPLVNGVGGGANGVLNGVEGSRYHGDVSSLDEVSKRSSKVSVTSSKYEEPQR